MATAQERTARGPTDAGTAARRSLVGSPQRLGEDRRRTRRRGISLALVLILLGAAGAVALSTRGQALVDVVVLAHPVKLGHVIAPEDLATVRMNVDGGRVRVSTPESAARDIVGGAVLLDLPAGHYLTPELVAAATPIDTGTVTVGVRLSEDALPAGTLRAREWVSVIRTDSSSGDAEELVPRAMVVSVSGLSFTDAGGSSGDGEVVVHLAVPSDTADAVAGAASVNGGLRLLGIKP